MYSTSIHMKPSLRALQVNCIAFDGPDGPPPMHFHINQKKRANKKKKKKKKTQPVKDKPGGCLDFLITVISQQNQTGAAEMLVGRATEKTAGKCTY